MRKLPLLLLFIFLSGAAAMACTSAIVSGKLTKSGKPLMWKHRDTGNPDNFVEYVKGHPGQRSFVALFNGGDSLLRDAWTGVNDAGFAIMNTASYNLAPDTTDWKDREGIVMRRALEKCVSLEDFENMLDTLPKPLGVQANFGVLDAYGKGAYYETNDYTYTRYLLDDEPSGILTRTNYSYSGEKDGGYGYIREENARRQLAGAIKRKDITPEIFTDTLSVRFYHSVLGRDFTNDTTVHFVVDQDFIPRKSSTASIVIEHTDLTPVMWTVLGYPPVGHVKKIAIDRLPLDMRPMQPGYKSAECNAALERKEEVFSIKRGSGPHYVNLDAVRRLRPAQEKRSREAYRE